MRRAVRRKTLIFLSIALLVLSAYAIAITYAFFHQEVKETKPPYRPSQGVYESCAPRDGDMCLERLKNIAAGGFKLVLNYSQLNGNAEQIIAYANEAHRLGIQIIWGMSNPILRNGTDLLHYYDLLAATCSCSDNASFIRYVVRLAQNLPSTWGYYVGDEVQTSEHEQMKAYSDLIHQTDPTHPRLFVSVESLATMGTDLAPFTDTADAVGSDIYPVGTANPTTSVGPVAHAIQAIANKSKKLSMIVLQAFSWAQYPNTLTQCVPLPACVHFPTEAEMHQMYKLVLQNAHPQFILWYSYFDILRSDDPAAHWKDLLAATR